MPSAGNPGIIDQTTQIAAPMIEIAEGVKDARFGTDIDGKDLR